MKEIITAIHKNGSFHHNKIIRPYLTDRLGLRLDLLWTDGKRYYAKCEAFGEFFTLKIPQKIGDDIWLKFKTQFEGNYSYEDI